MLYLKAINFEDAEKEYEALQKIPREENGFQNTYYGISFEEFKEKSIQELIDNSHGLNLRPEHVPGTYFFLWNDDEIVGLFKVRHVLNERLRNGAGHIGFGIIKEHRGKGYAKIGLGLAIEEFKKLNIDNSDELYLSCYKNNIGSLKAQLGNGAYIHHEDEEEYYNRIKL